MEGNSTLTHDKIDSHNIVLMNMYLFNVVM